MKRARIVIGTTLPLLLILVGACARAVPAQCRAAQPGGAAADSALAPARFEAEIRAFEAADRCLVTPGSRGPSCSWPTAST